MNCPILDKEANWIPVKSDTCCSLCSSMNPIQFLDFLNEVISKTDPELRISSNDNFDLIYIERPSIANISDGAMKIYLAHLDSYISQKGLNKAKVYEDIQKAITISQHKFNTYFKTLVIK